MNDRFGLVGKTIADRVRVDRVIGEGGFGVVYEGTHLVLGRPVAIKCSKPSPDDAEKASQIFVREGQILFELAHPSIVRLFDVGVIPESGVQYAVLELVPGRTLKDEIDSREREKRPFTRDEIAAVFVPILEGLAFAHSRGVVHRDLKPANMMLVPGGPPKILDFGTARSLAVDGTLGMTFTPAYAAPEQWDGRFGPAGPPTDVFALGLAMFHACLLRYPLTIGDTMMSIARAVADESDRPNLAVERPDLPRELGEVLLKATRPRQAERFTDARDMLASVRRVLGVVVSTAPLAKPMSAPPPAALPVIPPPAPMPSGSPSALAQSVPVVITMQHPAPRSSVPWIVAGVAVFLLLAGLVGAVPFVLRAQANAQATQANQAREDEVDAAASRALPPGPHKKVRIGSVVGGRSHWNQADVARVVDAHKADVVACADKVAATDPAVAGDVTVIVVPTDDGQVQRTMCSMIGMPPYEKDVCTCLDIAMGKWRFGKAKGAAIDPIGGRNFILSFTIEP